MRSSRRANPVDSPTECQYAARAVRSRLAFKAGFTNGLWAWAARAVSIVGLIAVAGLAGCGKVPSRPRADGGGGAGGNLADARAPDVAVGGDAGPVGDAGPDRGGDAGPGPGGDAGPGPGGDAGPRDTGVSAAAWDFSGSRWDNVPWN